MFGWKALTVDGHDMDAIGDAFSRLPLETGKPSALVFRTVKGKGVSFMENDYKWHYGGLNETLFEQVRFPVKLKFFQYSHSAPADLPADRVLLPC